MRKVGNSLSFLPLVVIGIAFIILRIPSLFEPHWYGDEGVYQVIGRGILSGRLLYQEIWDNKPPLLYLIYAVVNGNLFFAKLASLLAGIGSVAVFYLLSCALFKKNAARIVSLGLFSLFFATPLLEGNIANAENFMLLPIISSALLVVRYFQSKNIRTLIFAGVILSISLGIKMVTVFDFLSFVIFLIIAGWKDPLIERLKTTAYFLVSFISVMALFTLVFLIKGAFGDFVHAILFQNVSYVGENNSLVIPMGILFAKLILLISGIGGIFFFRKKFAWQTIFIYIWVLFSLFNIFFSERPYTHYVLLLLPSMALMVGLFFEFYKKRLLNGAIITAIILLVYIQFPLYEKNLRYYQNFLQFTLGGKSVDDYRNFFDGNTSLIYDLAQFIQVRAGSGEVFLWSDAPQIYVLADKLPVGKFVVSYHVNFYENAYAQTAREIEQAKPRYIIQTTSLEMQPDMIASYELKYIMKGAKIYERSI